MQTFDLLPASHGASPLNSGTDFTPQTQPSGGEKFGDVMDRALSAPPRDSNPNSDDNDSVAPENPGKHNVTKSGDSIPSKHTAKLKKSLRNDSSPNNPATDSQPATVGVSVPQATRAINMQIVPQDDVPSEGASETGAAKGKPGKAIGSSTNTIKPSADLLFAATRAPVGVPVPISTQTPTPTNTSKDSRSTSNPISNVLAKTEVSGDTIASTAEKNSGTSDSPGKSVPEKPDLKGLEAKTSSERSENAAPADNNGVKDQLASATDSHSGQAIPLEALKMVAPEVSNTPITNNAQIAQPKVSPADPTSPPTDPGGISAAKQYTTMKKAEKTPKVAGQNEQDLPGDPTSGSEDLLSAQKLPVHVLANANGKAESATPIEIPAAQRISTTPESAASAISSVAVTPVNTTDTRLRVLERTHDMVAMHAVSLAQTGSDSLHVVVKPGDGVQLSLELRQSEGMVQVRASLHKGDFEHMSQHWPELQQRLEARGVRVGTLTTSENFSSTSHQNSQQQKQQSSQHDPLYAGAFAEFALAGSLSETPAVRAARPTVHRGWETWA